MHISPHRGGRHVIAPGLFCFIPLPPLITSTDCAVNHASTALSPAGAQTFGWSSQPLWRINATVYLTICMFLRWLATPCLVTVWCAVAFCVHTRDSPALRYLNHLSQPHIAMSWFPRWFLILISDDAICKVHGNNQLSYRRCCKCLVCWWVGGLKGKEGLFARGQA